MSRLRIFALVASLLLALVLVAGAQGYVVILKSGHQVRCKAPITIEGPNAILQLATGTIASYPLVLVDLVETERYNQLGLGDATKIDELTIEGAVLATPTPRRKSLGNYTSIDASGFAAGGAALGPAEPTPTPTPGIELHTEKYHDGRVDQAFVKLFDEKELLIYKTSQGTVPEYYFVQTTTDSEREVFHALEIVAEAYVLIHKLHAQISPQAVELQMLQTSGKPAGTFRLTPELAQELASGETPTQTFYIKHVIF